MILLRAVREAQSTRRSTLSGGRGAIICVNGGSSYGTVSTTLLAISAVHELDASEGGEPVCGRSLATLE